MKGFVMRPCTSAISQRFDRSMTNASTKGACSSRNWLLLTPDHVKRATTTKKSTPRPIKIVFNARTCLLPRCRRTDPGANPHDIGMGTVPDLAYMTHEVDPWNWNPSETGCTLARVRQWFSYGLQSSGLGNAIFRGGILLAASDPRCTVGLHARRKLAKCSAGGVRPKHPVR